MRDSHERIDDRQSAIDNPAGLEVLAPQFSTACFESGGDDEVHYGQSLTLAS